MSTTQKATVILVEKLLVCDQCKAQHTHYCISTGDAFQALCEVCAPAGCIREFWTQRLFDAVDDRLRAQNALHWLHDLSQNEAYRQCIKVCEETKANIQTAYSSDEMRNAVIEAIDDIINDIQYDVDEDE